MGKPVDPLPQPFREQFKKILHHHVFSPVKEDGKTKKIHPVDEKKTHFDTSHHHTVLWEASKLDAAANALKATIRATLPHEAILEDPA